MVKNFYAPLYDNLPTEIAIFPLSGALLLPCGSLPLNIFEPRYLAMVEDALSTSHRMIGMVQPDKATDDAALFKTGCAGKIIEFSESTDGRYLITLSGVVRFHIRKEMDMYRGYRRVKPNWAAFTGDLGEQICHTLDRGRLQSLLKKYFLKQGMQCDWNAVSEAPDGYLITCLSMACPFTPQEKQALLEAPCCSTRAAVFMSMLEMAVCGNDNGICH